MMTARIRSLVSLLAIALGAFVPAALAQPTPVPYPTADDGETDAQPPRLLGWVNPRFPAALAEQSIDEDVHVAFVVAASGAPVKVRAFFSRHAELEAPAAEAVRQWTFSPGRVRGHPVSTQMVVAMHFKSPHHD